MPSPAAAPAPAATSAQRETPHSLPHSETRQAPPQSRSPIDPHDVASQMQPSPSASTAASLSPAPRRSRDSAATSRDQHPASLSAPSSLPDRSHRPLDTQPQYPAVESDPARSSQQSGRPTSRNSRAAESSPSADTRAKTPLAQSPPHRPHCPSCERPLGRYFHCERAPAHRTLPCLRPAPPGQSSDRSLAFSALDRESALAVRRLFLPHAVRKCRPARIVDGTLALPAEPGTKISRMACRIPVWPFVVIVKAGNRPG